MNLLIMMRNRVLRFYLVIGTIAVLAWLLVGIHVRKENRVRNAILIEDSTKRELYALYWGIDFYASHKEVEFHAVPKGTTIRIDGSLYAEIFPFTNDGYFEGRRKWFKRDGALDAWGNPYLVSIILRGETNNETGNVLELFKIR